MSKLITVIVPIYNVEDYLSMCVDSILAQTYKNIEVILVDDGSTDSSGEMCDKFAERDSRVRVIHQTNGGLSDARNAGLESAQGEYLIFCDGDDWIEKDLLHTAYQAIEKNEGDVAVWGYFADFVDEEERLQRRDIHECSNMVCTKEMNTDFLLEREILGLIGYAWNKLYKTALLTENKYKFQKGLSLVEDMIFNKPVLLKAKKVVFLDVIGTHYIQRPRVTLGTKYYPNYFKLKVKACQAREELLKGYHLDFSKVEKTLSALYVGAVLSTVKMIKHANCMEKNEKTKMLNQLWFQMNEEHVFEKCKKTTVKEKYFLFLVSKKCFQILLMLPVL